MGSTLEDKKLYFPEVARALKNGEFFKPGLSEYQQREQVLSPYARYQEYPEPWTEKLYSTTQTQRLTQI